MFRLISLKNSLRKQLIFNLLTKFLVAALLVAALATIGKVVATKINKDPLDPLLTALERTADDVLMDPSTRPGTMLFESSGSEDLTVPIEKEAYHKLETMAFLVKNEINKASIERIVTSNETINDAAVELINIKTFTNKEKLNRILFAVLSKEESFNAFGEIIVRYFKIQKRLYLNYLKYVHQHPSKEYLYPNSRYDKLNLLLEPQIGSFLLKNNETFKLQFNLWHASVHSEDHIGKIELGMTPQDKATVEYAALLDKKNLDNMAKLIQLLVVQERTVNHWAIESIYGSSPSKPTFNACAPNLLTFQQPSGAAAPVPLNFYENTEKDDRHQEFLEIRNGLVQVTYHRPLLDREPLLSLMKKYFEQWKPYRDQNRTEEEQKKNKEYFDVVADFGMPALEEQWQANASDIFDLANYPGDRLDDESIADRITEYSYHNWKSMLMSFVFKEAFGRKLFSESKEDLQRASKTLNEMFDQSLLGRSEVWKRDFKARLLSGLASDEARLIRDALVKARFERKFQEMIPAMKIGVHAAFVRDSIPKAFYIYRPVFEQTRRLFLKTEGKEPPSLQDLANVSAFGVLKERMRAPTPEVLKQYFYKKLKFFADEDDSHWRWMPKDKTYSFYERANTDLKKVVKEIQDNDRVMEAIDKLLTKIGERYYEVLKTKNLQPAEVTQSNTPLYGFLDEVIKNEYRAFLEDMNGGKLEEEISFNQKSNSQKQKKPEDAVKKKPADLMMLQVPKPLDQKNILTLGWMKAIEKTGSTVKFPMRDPNVPVPAPKSKYDDIFGPYNYANRDKWAGIQPQDGPMVKPPPPLSALPPVPKTGKLKDRDLKKKAHRLYIQALSILNLAHRIVDAKTLNAMIDDSYTQTGATTFSINDSKNIPFNGYKRSTNRQDQPVQFRIQRPEDKDKYQRNIQVRSPLSLEGVLRGQHQEKDIDKNIFNSLYDQKLLTEVIVENAIREHPMLGIQPPAKKVESPEKAPTLIDYVMARAMPAPQKVALTGEHVTSEKEQAADWGNAMTLEQAFNSQAKPGAPIVPKKSPAAPLPNAPKPVQLNPGRLYVYQPFAIEVARKIIKSGLGYARTNQKKLVDEACAARPFQTGEYTIGGPRGGSVDFAKGRKTKHVTTGLMGGSNREFRKIYNASPAYRSLLIQMDMAYMSLDNQLAYANRSKIEKWNEVSNYIGLVILVGMFAGWIVSAPIWWAGLRSLAASGDWALGAKAAHSLFGIKEGMTAFKAFFWGKKILAVKSIYAILLQTFFLGQFGVMTTVYFYTMPAQLKYQMQVSNAQIGGFSRSPIEKNHLNEYAAEIEEGKSGYILFAVMQLGFMPMVYKQLKGILGGPSKSALTKLKSEPGASKGNVNKNQGSNAHEAPTEGTVSAEGTAAEAASSGGKTVEPGTGGTHTGDAGTNSGAMPEAANGTTPAGTTSSTNSGSLLSRTKEKIVSKYNSIFHPEPAPPSTATAGQKALDVVKEQEQVVNTAEANFNQTKQKAENLKTEVDDLINKDPEEVVGIGRKKSELKLAEDEFNLANLDLDQANQRLQEVQKTFSKVSTTQEKIQHAIREPLARVEQASEDLKLASKNLEDAQQKLQQVQNAANQGSGATRAQAQVGVATRKLKDAQESYDKAKQILAEASQEAALARSKAEAVFNVPRTFFSRFNFTSANFTPGRRAMTNLIQEERALNAAEVSLAQANQKIKDIEAEITHIRENTKKVIKRVKNGETYELHEVSNYTPEMQGELIAKQEAVSKATVDVLAAEQNITRAKERIEIAKKTFNDVATYAEKVKNGIRGPNTAKAKASENLKIAKENLKNAKIKYQQLKSWKYEKGADLEAHTKNLSEAKTEYEAAQQAVKDAKQSLKEAKKAIKIARQTVKNENPYREKTVAEKLKDLWKYGKVMPFNARVGEEELYELLKPHLNRIFDDAPILEIEFKVQMNAIDKRIDVIREEIKGAQQASPVQSSSDFHDLWAAKINSMFPAKPGGSFANRWKPYGSQKQLLGFNEPHPFQDQFGNYAIKADPKTSTASIAFQPNAKAIEQGIQPFERTIQFGPREQYIFIKELKVKELYRDRNAIEDLLYKLRDKTKSLKKEMSSGDSGGSSNQLIVRKKTEQEAINEFFAELDEGERSLLVTVLKSMSSERFASDYQAIEAMYSPQREFDLMIKVKSINKKIAQREALIENGKLPQDTDKTPDWILRKLYQEQHGLNSALHEFEYLRMKWNLISPRESELNERVMAAFIKMEEREIFTTEQGLKYTKENPDLELVKLHDVYLKANQELEEFLRSRARMNLEPEWSIATALNQKYADYDSKMKELKSLMRHYRVLSADAALMEDVIQKDYQAKFNDLKWKEKWDAEVPLWHVFTNKFTKVKKSKNRQTTFGWFEKEENLVHKTPEAPKNPEAESPIESNSRAQGHEAPDDLNVQEPGGPPAATEAPGTDLVVPNESEINNTILEQLKAAMMQQIPEDVRFLGKKEKEPVTNNNFINPVVEESNMPSKLVVNKDGELDIVTPPATSPQGLNPKPDVPTESEIHRKTQKEIERIQEEQKNASMGLPPGKKLKKEGWSAADPEGAAQHEWKEGDLIAIMKAEDEARLEKLEIEKQRQEKRAEKRAKKNKLNHKPSMRERREIRIDEARETHENGIEWNYSTPIGKEHWAEWERALRAADVDHEIFGRITYYRYYAIVAKWTKDRKALVHQIYYQGQAQGGSF